MILPLGWGVIREVLESKGYTKEQIDEIEQVVQAVECDDLDDL